MTKITIPSKAEVRIEWKDFPHNFSKEGEKSLKLAFAKKYNVDSKRVKVVTVPIKLNKEGKKVIWTDGLVENVLNTESQRKLYKEWLDNEGIKDYDWDKIIELDDLANSLVTITVTEENCGVIWEPIELGVSNFLSFGDDVVIKYGNYKGLTLISSNPTNMGGKTNISVDAPMFVLFGTTTKTDKNEEIFNLHSGKDYVKAYMILSVLDEKYKIQRTLTRKEKKAGGYNVTNVVQYFKILDNGSEYELEDEENVENQQGEQARETNKLIKSLVGSKDDFENIICATSDTLANLLNTNVIGKTERGKMLTKFIGLDIIEKKERVMRDVKSKFEKTMKSNVYSIAGLQNDIKSNNEQVETNLETIKVKDTLVIEKDTTIKSLTEQKDVLMQSKHQIDPEILKVDSQTLNKSIKEDIEIGLSKKEEKEKIIKEKDSLLDLVFDKEKYNTILVKDKTLSIEESNLVIENKNLNTENDNLEKAKICPTCKRPLEGVNNEPKITENKKKVLANDVRLKEIAKELVITKEEKDKLDKIKEGVDKRDKLELSIAKTDVDMGLLREKILKNKDILKRYEQNKENIDKNNEIDIKLQTVTANLTTENAHRTIILGEIERLKTEIENFGKENKTKESLIADIKIEQKKLSEYNLFISLIDSKRGIGKIVLKNTLPVINYTINEMLNDVCDFEVELDLNQSNEVEIYMIRNGISSKIKGSSGFESFATALALRVVFSRLSTLPKPNFLILDEILGGKVAADNLDKIQMVIENIKKYFGTIFFITHDDRTKDWCDKIISINKKDNISYIN